MPLKIIDNSIGREVLFSNIEFVEEEQNKYYKISSSDNENYINIQYVPIKISNWDKNLFDIYLFENDYLSAENDVFEIYEKTIDERLGWIFPITILESNENDYVNHKNLNDYKHIAYQKLLEYNYSIDSLEKAGDFIKLSEIYGNVIICLLHKNTTSKIANFNINNFLLSFYKNGYLYFNGSFKSKSIYDRTSFVTEKRRNKRIYIENSNFDIFKNGFTKSLFIEHLLQSDNYLVRFIFLYQIIEYFIDIHSEKLFYDHIENYLFNSATKNDFRENINQSSTERQVINDIFNNSKISDDLKTEFNTEVDFFFNDIGKVYRKNSFGDKIYNLRNLITHNIREYTDKHDTLNKINEIFERIIIELLINNKDN